MPELGLPVPLKFLAAATRVVATCVHPLVFRRSPWIAIGWIVVFWRLGYASLLDPDEAHYAELTREMLHSGSWLVPLLDGKPFIDKPVLFHWLQGASRAPARRNGVRRTAAHGVVGGRSVCDHPLGRRGALRRRGRFTRRHHVRDDSGDVCPVIDRDLRHGLRAVSVRRGGLPARCGQAIAAFGRRAGGYVLLTLAVMTKGPVALVLVALFLAAALRRSRVRPEAWLARCTGRSGFRRWRSPLRRGSSGCSGEFGDEFVKGYLLAGNLWYVTQPIEFSARAINHTFYVRAFTGAFFPGASLCAGRGVDVFRRLRANEPIEIGERLLWLWTMVVVGFFSVARFKLDHYIFPAAPACCLLAAHAWREAARDTDGSSMGHALQRSARRRCADRRRKLWRGRAVATQSWSASGGRSSSRLPYSSAALCCCFNGADRWRVPSESVWWSRCCSSATRPSSRWVSRRSSRCGRPLGSRASLRASRAHGSRSACISSNDGVAAFATTLNRPIHRLETVDEVSAFLSRPEPVYVVMLRRDYLELREHGTSRCICCRRTGRSSARADAGSVGSAGDFSWSSRTFRGAARDRSYGAYARAWRTNEG